MFGGHTLSFRNFPTKGCSHTIGIRTYVGLFSCLNDDDVMKKVVQEVLRVLHHHFAGYPEVNEHLLKAIFGLETSV